MQYNSLNSVIISHTIDVWQTYQFDITYYKNLILRSHVAKSADTVGRWLAPEPINVAPEFERKHNVFNNLSWVPQYVLHSTSVFNKSTKNMNTRATEQVQHFPLSMGFLLMMMMTYKQLLKITESFQQPKR